jgi:hypothetical protein
VCNSSDKDGKCVALQRKIGRWGARGVLRAGDPNFASSMRYEIVGLLSARYLLTASPEFRVRKLRARDDERRVHAGFCKLTSEKTPLLRGWVNKGFCALSIWSIPATARR